MKTPHAALTIASAALIAVAGFTLAGPLDPPAGPVAPTYKTLAEVEPRTAINAANTPGDADSLFRISQSGSYYLTGNITGVIGKHGVEIATSGVTLDLNGFDLAGVAGMGAFDGVSATFSGSHDIAVLNGSVRSWGGDGVDLMTASAINSLVEGVAAIGNAGNGISIGTGGRVINCSGSFNAISAIRTSFGCTVTHCTATFNTASGISTGSGCTITACTAHQNNGGGFGTSVGCTVSGCTAFNNGGIGIGTDVGCTVIDCSADGNLGAGISVMSGCTLAGCAARSNITDGIACTSGCVIRDNTAENSGAAGIHATGVDNRIEGNNCTLCLRGVGIDGPGNIILRNTCSGNTTNWVIAANNYYGSIVDRTGVATAGVNGSFAIGTLTTSDPHANFSY